LRDAKVRRCRVASAQRLLHQGDKIAALVNGQFDPHPKGIILMPDLLHPSAKRRRLNAGIERQRGRN
jgi:hypothetical protein